MSTVPTRLDDLGPRSVAVVFGTRPEIVKLAGVIDMLGPQARTIYSGQHFDEELSGIFLDELGLRAPDVLLDIGSRRRGQQLGRLVTQLEDRFFDDPPRVVIVQGDTNTALGGALAANAAAVPLVHVEAGLRSHDRRMPEEHNRVVADHLADLCLAPTEASRRNLLEEGIADGRVAVTGNTVVDAANRLLPPAGARGRLLAAMGLVPSAFVLATFHRPENVDDRARLEVILKELATLDIPVVFAVHPRTRARMIEFGLDDLAAGLMMVPPLGYSTFLGLAAESALLVSDSGGVQEEASIVKRPLLIVRRSTERPEVLGTFATLVPDPADIARTAERLLCRIDDLHRELARLHCPYGDGRAAERCIQQLPRVLAGNRGCGAW